jgi:type I restriction enzyme M protein
MQDPYIVASPASPPPRNPSPEPGTSQGYKPIFPRLQALLAQRGLSLEDFRGLYTTRDVARIFGRSPPTINRWCREGMAPTKPAKTQTPQSTAQQLASLIKSCRDIMRKDKGSSGDLDRLPMLTWIMFLKFLDEMERVREEEAKLEGRRFRPAIERPYRWRDWAAQAEGIKGPELLAFINQDEATRPDGTKGPGLFAYLRGLQSSNGDRRDVIAKVFEGTVNRMVSGYLLRDVLNKVNEIHFTSRDEIHTLGLLYESMLKEMRDAAGDSGYTPRPLVKFIVTVVDPQLEETVLDPAAGTGGFLVESFEHLRAQAKKAEQFAHLQRGTLFGIEPKPLSLASAGGQGSEAETDCRYD